jgi:hypothetical protein
MTCGDHDVLSMPRVGGAADRECSFGENLRKYIEAQASKPADEVEQSVAVLDADSARPTLARRASQYVGAAR